MTKKGGASMCSRSNAIGSGKVKGKARVESSKIGRGTFNDDVGLGNVPTMSSQDSGEGETGEEGRRARTAKRRCTQEASDKYLAEKLQREWRAVGGKSNSVGAHGEQKGCGGTNHFMSRTQAGYMEANVRRGCCLCTDCAVSLAKEIISGPGLIILRGAADEATIQAARQAILELEHGDTDARCGELGPQHVRTWNLINKGSTFVDLVTNAHIFKILKHILGKDFALGSLSANHLRPGCPRGRCHIDFPYSHMEAATFPAEPIGIQATICLDAFTSQNGATEVELYSQLSRSHPDKDFEPNTRVEADPGDILIYNGLLHHRSGANRADQGRVGLLCQFLVKYARPMEEQLFHTTAKQLRQSSNMRLRQLLALD